AALVADKAHQPPPPGPKPQRARPRLANSRHVDAARGAAVALVEVAAIRLAPQVVGGHPIARAEPKGVGRIFFINGIDIVIGQRGLARQLAPEPAEGLLPQVDPVEAAGRGAQPHHLGAVFKHLMHPF
nr:hypothetical protein [Tanacetum cinerariifolium]